MSVRITNKNGKKIILLNPKEKHVKYFNEVQRDLHLTNDGHIKTSKYGNVKKLTNTQKAYRAGYNACYKDCAKAFFANK